MTGSSKAKCPISLREGDERRIDQAEGNNAECKVDSENSDIDKWLIRGSAQMPCKQKHRRAIRHNVACNHIKILPLELLPLLFS